LMTDLRCAATSQSGDKSATLKSVGVVGTPGRGAVSELSAYKYRVFLSYSHRDKAWSRWLQAALENYPIAQELVGRETPAGLVPRTLRPIYRDRDAAVTERPPGERTLAALRASPYLVVVCSRHAARSRRVNEEIRRFTALGRADCVIPVIVDGEPGDP